MASTSAFMPRLMSVLLAVHLIFLDFLPWVAMVLPPPRYTTLSSLEENILQQGFYYLSLFISGNVSLSQQGKEHCMDENEHNISLAQAQQSRLLRQILL